MKPAKRSTLFTSALLVVCLAASVMFLRRVDQLRTNATLDVLYITSPKMVKRLSLGYDGLLADIYWTRAVQYFGSRHSEHARSYQSLYPPPPHGAGVPEKAVQLVQYGIEKNPTAWKLYYDLGFIYYMELKEYEKAAEAFQKGSTIEGAHPFMKVLAAQMAQHAGDAQMARAIWTTTYETSQDKQIRANAIAHLRALKVEEDATRIQDAVTAYGRSTGNLPAGMHTLIAAGLLPGIPIDPDGQPYKLTRGRVELANPDDFPFVTKGLPLGYVPPERKNLDKLVH